MRHVARFLSACALSSALGSCQGPQSALSPAGRDAEQIADLFTTMAIGAAVIWALVLGSALYAVLRPEKRTSKRAAGIFIVGGGIVLPTIVLTALVIRGLRLLPGLLDLGADGPAAMRVTAEQWWWRMSYRLPDGTHVEAANEVRVAVDRRVALELDSPEVIHSFWVPSLHGKVDAIPGHITRIALEPTRTGTFRGACAEYCGAAHAQMVFWTVAMEPAAYEAWLHHQAEDAPPPATEQARRGHDAFFELGCAACHAIRGTPANGKVGPDLTHVGSRLSIAGVLDNDEAGFRRWLQAPAEVKPEAHMPAFDMLPARDVDALTAYLEGLQ